MKIKLFHIFLLMTPILGVIIGMQLPQEPVQDSTKTKVIKTDSLKVDTLTRNYSDQLEQFKKATPKKDKK